MKSLQDASRVNLKVHHRSHKRSFLLDGVRTGITVGVLSALWHFGWLILVATNTAQMVCDAMLRLHSIEPVYLVSPFRLEFALALIALSTAGGFLVGYLYALIWNSVGKIARRQKANSQTIG